MIVMEPPALPSCLDRRRRKPDEVLLSWGQRADGTMAHIGEVERGLKCGCVCPGCDARLAAVKGALKEHHFRHYHAVPCKQAYESALHKLAKDMLDERRELLLPEVRARIGTRDHVVSPEKRHQFDDAVLEHRLESIVPDVIVRKGKRQLLVEMVVTHRCGPDKIARIRELGLSCVEIDLSRLPRDATREDVAAALVADARRIWINNPKIERAHEALSQIIADEADAARRAVEKAARERAARFEAVTDRVYELRENPITHRRPDSALVQAVRAAGFSDQIGRSVVGDYLIALDPREWQAMVIDHFVLGPLEQKSGSTDFHATAAFKLLRPRGLLRSGAPAFVEAEMQVELSVYFPDFQAPFKIVESYLKWLAEHNVLTRMGKTFSVSSATRTAWNRRRQRRAALDDRAAGLRTQVTAILRALPPEEIGSFSAERWWTDALAPFGMSPAALYATDDGRLTTLEHGIDTLAAMVSRKGEPADVLLGLPLDGARERAARAKTARLEAKRLAEEQEREASRKRRVERLEDGARTGLDEEAETWLSTPQAALDGHSPRDQAALSDAGFWRAENLLADTSRARSQRLKCARFREELLKQAGSARRPDHARAFLTSSNPRWHNRHPIEFCFDERSFERLRTAMIEAAR